MSNKWSVPELWPGNTAYIIGGGSSLNTTGLLPAPQNMPAIIAKMNEDLAVIKDKRVIGVNNAYELGNWVDVCWFADVRWYEWNRKKLLEFQGLKVCCCPTLAAPERPGIKVLKRSNQLGLSEDKKTIKLSKSSGSSAINLALHFGVKRIVLLGFDMYVGWDGYHNWHDNHEVKGHSPASPYERFLQTFVNIAVDAKRLGVEIINCNLESKITQFEKKTLAEFVNDTKHGGVSILEKPEVVKTVKAVIKTQPPIPIAIDKNKKLTFRERILKLKESFLCFRRKPNSTVDMWQVEYLRDGKVTKTPYMQDQLAVLDLALEEAAK